MPKRANILLPQWSIDVHLLCRLILAGPPFPVFEGVALPTPPQPQPSITTSRLPPLGPAERERYRNMFVNTGARDGLLDGEQARTIFLRARLPNETLGQIW
jgi:epidermal growth factor receptor substrate 15